MSTITVNPDGSFNSQNFWVPNTTGTTNARFAEQTGSSGGPLSPHQEATFSSFEFESNGLTYRYSGQFTVVADFGVLDGQVAASGFYDEVEVLSGNTVLATYEGPDRTVDFGTYADGSVLGLLGGLLGGALDLLLGTPAGNEAVANLHTDATPGLAAQAVADGVTATGGAGGDTLTGGVAVDFLYGNAGNDVLSGGNGNDNLFAGLGVDQLFGGAGMDLVRYDDDDYGNLVIRLAGQGLNTGAAAGDTYNSIEGIVAGAGNDTLVGDGGANFLFGRGGNDAIIGAAGNDTLYGESGADNLFGGAGADRHFGGAGFDLARYDDANYGNLVIRLDQPNLNTGAAAGDTYIDIEGLVGGAGNDTIYGDIAANQLFGRAGNDDIYGGNGADTLRGEEGNDNLYGGFGADVHIGGDGLDFARYDDANYGNLNVRLDVPSLNTGVAAGDTYSGIEGLIGGVGNDTLIGNVGQNQLIGGAGNDALNGGRGNDTLIGQGGADKFCFSTAPGVNNVDRIVDFTHGVDDIVLFDGVYSGIGTKLDAAEFGSDLNNFIIYNQTTGQLFYDANGATGGPDPVLFASVAIGTVLDINDFQIV